MITTKNIKDYEFTFQGLDKVFNAEKAEYEQQSNGTSSEVLELVKMLGIKKGFKQKEECEYPKTKKYLKERIFSCENSTCMYIIERGRLVAKPEELWKKYAKKIKRKGQKFVDFLDDCESLYETEVLDDDFIVDLENFKVNLKPKLPFSYDPNAEVDAENGQILLDVMKEIMTSNIEEEWEALKYFIACMLQSKRSELVVVLQSLGGVGKSFVVNQIIKRLLGDGFAKLTDAILTGEERFNEFLIGARCGMLEETSGVNSEKYLEIIKTMKENSTDAVMVIRKMRVSPQPYKSYINYMVNSNNYRDLNLSDRRIFLLTISNKYQQNVAFFEALAAKVSDKSLQYIFNYFYTVKTPSRMLAPETEGKQDYKEEAMSTIERFLISELIINNPQQELSENSREMFTKYEEWAKANKKKSAQFAVFSNTIRQYVEKTLRPDGKEKKVNGYVYYNFSRDHVYERLITRSKVLTKDQFDRWVFEHQSNKKKEEHNVFETEEDIIKKNDIEIYKLKQEIEELKKLLNEKNEKSEKEKSKSEKVVDEFEVKLEKPIKYKQHPNKDYDLDYLLD